MHYQRKLKIEPIHFRWSPKIDELMPLEGDFCILSNTIRHVI